MIVEVKKIILLDWKIDFKIEMYLAGAEFKLDSTKT